MDSVYSPSDYGPLGMPGGMPNTQPGPTAIQYDPASMRQFFVVSDSQHGAKPARTRRKSASGSEQVKHRRTRSGCFTCRTRRVKCDETHPICERCAKGSRECKYPEVVPSKSGPKSKRTHTSREDSSSLDELEEGDEEADETPSMLSEMNASDVGSGQRLHAESLPGGRGVTRRASWTTNSEKRIKNRPPMLRKASYDPTPSPSTFNDANSLYAESPTPTSPTRSLRHMSSTSSLMNQPWAHLPSEISFYFSYAKNRITCHHYMLKADRTGFFQTALLEEAVKSESLMYAVTAFASLRYHVDIKSGKFHTFLEYYNTAVSKLRETLERPPTLATLLTILQLASFEEYLGDWGNLVAHRNAAAKVIESLYTPETMAATAQTRTIYTWYSRFDIFAAMMGGHRTALGQKWSESNRKVCLAERNANPGNIDMQTEYCIAVLRDIAIDSSILAVHATPGLVSLEDFDRKAAELARRIEECEQEIYMHLAGNPTHVAPRPMSDEFYSPFLPGTCWKGSRWHVGLMICDLEGLKMMVRHHMSVAHQEVISTEQAETGKRICSHIAATLAEGEAPPGWMLPTQAPLGLAALWVQDEPNFRLWIRKAMGMIESEGFIFPKAFRMRISQLWGDPSIAQSWMTSASTNDGGASMRHLVEADERSEEQEDTQLTESRAQDNNTKKDIREMRALLQTMRVGEGGHLGHLDSSASSQSAESPASHPGSALFRNMNEWQ